MRSLLWKDFRQNRKVLWISCILALVPYVVPYTVALVATIFERTYHPERIPDLPGMDAWVAIARGASLVSMALSVILAAFIGGHAIAGERADRSAEFAAGLPIPRGKSVASKATVGLASCLAIWAVNAVVWAIAFPVVSAFTSPGFSYSDEAMTVRACLLCTLLLFGLSWLYSSLLSSPAISAAAAIGTATALFLVVSRLYGFELGQAMNDSFRTCLFVLPPLIAVPCLAAGVLIYLKRVEG